MATIQRFEDIQAWQMARELNGLINKLIDEGLFQKNFTLIDQIRRSAGSVMDNIAEGFERGTRKEFIVFLGYSKGSCGELRSQLYRTFDNGYISETQFSTFAEIAISISKMLQKLIEYLQQTNIAGVRNRNKEK